MALQFLAALGPLLSSIGGAAASGAGAIGTGLGAAGKFAAAHPKITKSLLQGLGGGLMAEMDNGGQAYNQYLQMLMNAGVQPNQQGQHQIGSTQLPGTIVN